MSTILTEADGDTQAIAGQTVAVVGYGNQGRSWALNLRDAGLAVQVCVRADATRDQAVADGVHADVTGTARPRTLAVAKAIGGLRQGAIELTAMQEAVLDLAVEQALAPALRKVHETFVTVMLE